MKMFLAASLVGLIVSVVLEKFGIRKRSPRVRIPVFSTDIGLSSQQQKSIHEKKNLTLFFVSCFSRAVAISALDGRAVMVPIWLVLPFSALE